MSNSRALALLSGFVISALLLAACGSSPAPAGQGSGSATTGEPVKIGVLLTLSGSAGAVGEKQRIGIELAVADINAAGGILGRPVEIVVRDDAGDPTKARTAAEELVAKENVAFIIGPTLSSPAMAVNPYLTEQKVISLGSPAAAAATDPANFPYAFTTAADDALISRTLIGFALDTLNLQRLAVLSESTAFGKASVAVQETLFADRQYQPAAWLEYTSGDLDFSAQLRAAQEAGADGLIINSPNPADLTRFMKTLQSMGWEVPVLGTIVLSDATVIEGVGRDGMQHAYSYSNRPFTYSASEPLAERTVEFREKVRARMGGATPLKTSIELTAAMYDGVHVLARAVERAGGFDADQVKAALESMEEYDGLYATWQFTPTKHIAVSEDDLVMVIAGTCEDAVCQKP